MRPPRPSRRTALRGVLAACLALSAGCASGQPPEVRRLQAEAAYERGFGDLKDGRLGAGLAGLREAVSLDPGNAKYHMVLGKWLLDLKQPAARQEAIAELQRAVELEPTNAYALNLLGAALNEESRWGQAIDYFRRALAVPTYPEPQVARHNLAWALYNIGRLKEAEDSLRLALSLDPAFPEAYYTLGLVLVRQGRPEEAKLAFRRAQELAPDSLGGAAAAHLRALGDGG